MYHTQVLIITQLGLHESYMCCCCCCSIDACSKAAFNTLLVSLWCKCSVKPPSFQVILDHSLSLLFWPPSFSLWGWGFLFSFHLLRALAVCLSSLKYLPCIDMHEGVASVCKAHFYREKPSPLDACVLLLARLVVRRPFPQWIMRVLGGQYRTGHSTYEAFGSLNEFVSLLLAYPCACRSCDN